MRPRSQSIIFSKATQYWSDIKEQHKRKANTCELFLGGFFQQFITDFSISHKLDRNISRLWTKLHSGTESPRRHPVSDRRFVLDDICSLSRYVLAIQLGRCSFTSFLSADKVTRRANQEKKRRRHRSPSLMGHRFPPWASPSCFFLGRLVWCLSVSGTQIYTCFPYPRCPCAAGLSLHLPVFSEGLPNALVVSSLAKKQQRMFLRCFVTCE